MSERMPGAFSGSVAEETAPQPSERITFTTVARDAVERANNLSPETDQREKAHLVASRFFNATTSLRKHREEAIKKDAEAANVVIPKNARIDRSAIDAALSLIEERYSRDVTARSPQEKRFKERVLNRRLGYTQAGFATGMALLTGTGIATAELMSGHKLEGIMQSVFSNPVYLSALAAGGGFNVIHAIQGVKEKSVKKTLIEESGDDEYQNTAAEIDAMVDESPIQMKRLKSKAWTEYLKRLKEQEQANKAAEGERAKEKGKKHIDVISEDESALAIRTSLLREEIEAITNNARLSPEKKQQAIAKTLTLAHSVIKQSNPRGELQLWHERNFRKPQSLYVAGGVLATRLLAGIAGSTHLLSSAQEASTAGAMNIAMIAGLIAAATNYNKGSLLPFPPSDEALLANGKFKFRGGLVESVEDFIKGNPNGALDRAIEDLLQYTPYLSKEGGERLQRGAETVYLDHFVENNLTQDPPDSFEKIKERFNPEVKVVKAMAESKAWLVLHPKNKEDMKKFVVRSNGNALTPEKKQDGSLVIELITGLHYQLGTTENSRFIPISEIGLITAEQTELTSDIEGDADEIAGNFIASGIFDQYTPPQEQI